jgi:hypothetical protein
MTRDEIIDFAHEADKYNYKDEYFFSFNLNELTRAFEAVSAHEREACASLLDKHNSQVHINGWVDCANERSRCAHAIRTRSQGGASHE